MVTPERLMQFTFGFAPPLIIEAAIRHRVFDVLDAGAKTVDKVCAETRTSERGMRALLNALVGLELLAKDHEGCYALTPESATFLVSEKPSFHGAFFLLTSEPMLSAWRNLYEIVRTGRPAQHINLEQDGVPRSHDPFEFFGGASQVDGDTKPLGRKAFLLETGQERLCTIDSDENDVVADFRRPRPELLVELGLKRAEFDHAGGD